jgi:glucose-6-phosphate isomerase
VGFFDWVAHPTGIDEIYDVAAELKREFEGAIILGIGGSYLGPASLIEALRPVEQETKFPICWVSNSDTRTIAKATRLAQSRKMATVITSKSGNTVETLGGFFSLAQYLDPKGYCAITDPTTGILRGLVEKQKWHSLPVPPSIGGRYSVLTAVGLLPALLGDVDARSLIRGALSMQKALTAAGTKNPAFQLAARLHAWDTHHHHPIQYLMPYHSGLQLMADWYVQLFAESLGKDGKGPTPIGALGTTDQHSQLQLWKEGPRDKVIGFLDVLSSGNSVRIAKPPFAVDKNDYLFRHNFDEVNHLASLATQKSLQNSHVPTYRIEIAKLSAEALGSLYFFFETACAFAGELYGVDAFNQPGVEEAKRLLHSSL